MTLPAGRVGPPAEDEAPAVDGGVPGDDDDAGVIRMTSHEGVEEGAGNRGPQGQAGLSVVSSTQQVKMTALETTGVRKT